ncbi:MAG: peptidase MA family metallohydrolase [Acidobacteriota bacterium]
MRLAEGRPLSARRLAVFALLGAAALALPLLAAPLAAPALPRLIIQVPPELAGDAAILQRIDPAALRPAMELTGLTDPGPPIVVVLATESSAAGRSAPPWVTGFTAGVTGVVVLLPERVPRYPDRSLVTLLQHEVTHVLVSRAAQGKPVPRWLDEGLAMAASRDPDLEDRTRVALAVLTDRRLPLRRIDDAFAGNSGQVQAAYALARDFVEELLRRYGNGAGAAILRGIARGEPFEEAFRRATGAELSAVEASYWRRRTFWDRWVPFATSSAALWGAVTALALLAFRRRRARDAAIHRRWEEEDRARRAREEAAASEDDLVN